MKGTVDVQAHISCAIRLQLASNATIDRFAAAGPRRSVPALQREEPVDA
jgi:hypothetical protein